MSNTNGAPSAAAKLFDLRTVIAILFGFYGVVLTALGLFATDPAQLQKSAGIDMNLWTGIGMLIVAAVFLIWERQRPLVHRSEDGNG